MKRVLIILVFAASCFFIYQHFFQARTDPILRLSLFIDEHIDGILGPLPTGVKTLTAVPSQTHNLRILREDITDRRHNAHSSESLRCSTAAQLCDVLLVASEERDKHLARLNDTRSKNNYSLLAVDKARDAAERLRYFENGIALSWKEASAKIRAIVDRKYAQLRAFERK